MSHLPQKNAFSIPTQSKFFVDDAYLRPTATTRQVAESAVSRGTCEQRRISAALPGLVQVFLLLGPGGI